MAGLLDGIAGIAGTAQRQAQQAARKKPAKRKAPARRAPVAPQRDIVRDAAAQTFGTATGAIRAAARGDTPAQTRRAVKRDVQANRRSASIRDYLDAPRAERSKQAAAAEKRVAAGSASTKDKLIVQTHERRTKNDAGRSRSAVKAANEAHDRAVARERVADLVAGLGKTGRGTASKSDGGILGKLAKDAKNAPSDIAEFAGDAAKTGVNALADVGIAGADALTAASKLKLPGTSDSMKGTRAGIDAAGGAKAAALAVKVPANIVKVTAEDPSQGLRAAGDIAKMVRDIPAGVIAAAKDPKGAGKAAIDDYKRRYGPLVEGRDAEFRDRMKKEGIAPEVVDVLGFASGGSTAAAKTGSGIAKVLAKRSNEGTRVNRGANRSIAFLNDARPDLQVAPGVRKPQRKSSGIVGIAAQRGLDRSRAKKTVKQLEEAKARRAPATTQKQRNRNADPSYGRGVRGWVPEAGAVVPLRTKRGARKQVGKVTSVGFRRLDRLSNKLSRDAGQRFRALSVREQRAAVLALEGLANVTDPKATLAMVSARLGKIEASRARMRRESPDRWESDYAPLIDSPTDEARHLRELEADLKENPGKVLTPRLQRFVDGERARIPAVEQVGLDSMRPETMTARRFAPAGQTLGTRKQYETERAAVERLEAFAKAKDPAAAAIAAIRPELEQARARGSVDDVRALQAEAQAIRRVSDEYRGDVGKARVGIVEAFVSRTRQAADAQGLGALDPSYVLHRKDQGSVASSFSAGGGEGGAVAPSKRTNMRLLDTGFRDMSASAYELGIQSSIKRSVQWRMVQEIIEDFVPGWAKNGGKGFEWKDFQVAVARQQKNGVILDPQDWTVWTPKREQTGWSDRTDALDGNLPAEDLRELGTPVELKAGQSFADLASGPMPEWATKGQRFYLIPRDVLGEMKRGGPASVSTAWRTALRFTTGQAGLILASMPTYAIRQIMQSVPMVALSVGGRVIDPVFYRSLHAYMRAKKVNPDQYEDVLDMLGVRSRSLDAVTNQRAGSTARDLHRFETTLKHSWGGLFGGNLKDYMVSPRNSGGAKGTASQVARTTGKVAFTPFRAMRDFNVAVDQFQDRWARLIALAAEDARMSRAGAQQFGAKASSSMAENAKRLGPIAGALELPADELAKLVRTKGFRRQVDDAADGVAKWLGDYANYTQREQQVARAVIPFYGFARHSLRLMAYTMPMQHPLMFAMVLQQAEITAKEKEEMVREYAGKMSASPDMLPGLLLVAKGDGDLGMVDTKWLNPLTGPAFEVLDATVGGSNPAEGITSIFTPLLGAGVEALSGTRTFTQQRLETGKGPLPPGEKLGGGDAVRLVANRFMSSLYPYRALNELMNGEKGRLADTSLLFDPQPIVRKAGGESAQRNTKRIERRQDRGDLRTFLDMTVPLRAKPADTLIDSAIYAGEKQAKKESPKKKTKKRSTGGGYGFGSSGGSAGFGSGSSPGAGY